MHCVNVETSGRLSSTSPRFFFFFWKETKIIIIIINKMEEETGLVLYVVVVVFWRGCMLRARRRTLSIQKKNIQFDSCGRSVMASAGRA